MRSPNLVRFGEFGAAIAQQRLERVLTGNAGNAFGLRSGTAPARSVLPPTLTGRGGERGSVAGRTYDVLRRNPAPCLSLQAGSGTSVRVVLREAPEAGQVRIELAG